MIERRGGSNKIMRTCICKGLPVIILFLLVTALPVFAGDGVTRYWAILIGIADYQSIEDLTYADQDAISVYNLLLQDSRWNQSRMSLLTNSLASKSAIESAISGMAKNCDDDDVFLFFFSGHGGQAAQDFSPSDEADGMDEYIACWDSSPYDYDHDLIDDQLGDMLGQIKGKKVVMLDACHGGGHLKSISKTADSLKKPERRKVKFTSKTFEHSTGIASKADGFTADLKASQSKDANDKSNIIILTASDDDENSYESPEFDHGEFTYFLLLALKSNDVNGNDSVSAEEAFAYLNPALKNHTKSEVTPQIYDSVSGEIDLVRPVADRLIFIGYGDVKDEYPYPFNTYYKKSRTEYIYTKSQLGEAGTIISLRLFPAEKPGLSLNNCTIRMKHTTATQYSAPLQWASSGWTTVYSGTKTFTDTKPVLFELSTPFPYDGMSNLIVDFSFSNQSWASGGDFWSSYSSTYPMIYYRTDENTYGEPTAWSGTFPQPVRYAVPQGSLLDVELEFQLDSTPQLPLYFDTLQKIYVAYYQRPADPGGLLWWAERLKEANGDVSTIMEAFATSPESRALYGTIDNTTIADVVSGIYMALLNRPASEGEKGYWVGLFKEGKVTAAAIALIMVNGAQNEDLVTMNNKVAAANLFTRVIDPELDGANFKYDYSGGLAEAARSLLSGVASDVSTIPSEEEIKNLFAEKPVYSYTVVPSGGWTDLQAMAINNYGQILVSGKDVGGQTASMRYDSSNGSLTSMTMVAIGWNASDMNDQGELTGYSEDSSGQASGVLKIGAGKTTLLPSGWSEVWPQKINNSCQVVGWGWNPSGDARGFLYSNGTYTTLIPPGWTYSWAYGINNSGQVVGYGYNNSSQMGAFLYSNGTYTTLMPPGWTEAYGKGINDNGQVVGFGKDSSQRQRGFLYSNGGYTILIPPGWTDAWAYRINSNGQVVGEGFDASGKELGFLYSNGSYTTLTPPGWTKSWTEGINNNGQVVGEGNNDASGTIRIFLATP